MKDKDESCKDVGWSNWGYFLDEYCVEGLKADSNLEGIVGKKMLTKNALIYLESMWKLGETVAFSPYRRCNGSILPNWLMRRGDLSHGSKVVYARLAQFARKDLSIAVSVQNIADEVGCGARQVIRYLDELEDSGLIIKKSRKQDGRSSQFFFVMTKEIALEAIDDKDDIESWTTLVPRVVSENPVSEDSSSVTEVFQEEAQRYDATDMSSTHRYDTSDASEVCHLLSQSIITSDIPGMTLTTNDSLQESEKISEEKTRAGARSLLPESRQPFHVIREFREREEREERKERKEFHENKEIPRHVGKTPTPRWMSSDGDSAKSSKISGNPVPKTLVAAERAVNQAGFTEETEPSLDRASALLVEAAKASQKSQAEQASKAERRATQARKNLDGKLYDNNTAAFFKKCEQNWKRLFAEYFPGSVAVDWRAPEKKAVEDLLGRGYTQEHVLLAMHYVAENWEKIKENRLGTKGGSRIPSISLLSSKMHATIFDDALVYKGFFEIRKQVDAWRSEHPNDFFEIDGPEDLRDRYETERKALESAKIL